MQHGSGYDSVLNGDFRKVTIDRGLEHPRSGLQSLYCVGRDQLVGYTSFQPEGGASEF